MAILNIKIVGSEGDSVLVKYSTENSEKSIDEYEAVAYQPKAMGFANLDEFIEGIRPSLLNHALYRDSVEKLANHQLDLDSWVGHESNHVYAPPHNPSLVQTNEAIKEPEVTI